MTVIGRRSMGGDRQMRYFECGIRAGRWSDESQRLVTVTAVRVTRIEMMHLCLRDLKDEAHYGFYNVATQI